MDFMLQVRFDRGESHSSEKADGFPPQLLITRCSEKVMPGPCQREQEVLLAVLRDGPPIRWEKHGRAVGGIAADQARLVQQHQVLTNGLVIRGWIWNGTIALEKEQQITDQIHVSVHGLVISAVIIHSGRIVGVYVDW